MRKRMVLLAAACMACAFRTSSPLAADMPVLETETISEATGAVSEDIEEDIEETTVKSSAESSAIESATADTGAEGDLTETIEGETTESTGGGPEEWDKETLDFSEFPENLRKMMEEEAKEGWVPPETGGNSELSEELSDEEVKAAQADFLTDDKVYVPDNINYSGKLKPVVLSDGETDPHHYVWDGPETRLGTITISLGDIPLADSVVYTIIGTNTDSWEEYKVTLYRKYGFTTTVELPAGYYQDKSSASTKVTFVDGKKLAEGCRTSFAYRGSDKFFGEHYAIGVGMSRTIGANTVLCVRNRAGMVQQIQTKEDYGDALIEGSVEEATASEAEHEDTQHGVTGHTGVGTQESVASENGKEKEMDGKKRGISIIPIIIVGGAAVVGVYLLIKKLL